MSPSHGSVVTIGAYDGVHLGHQQVLSEVCRIARDEGLDGVAVTFDRHPAAVVRPESAPLLLTDLPQRLELLAAAGIVDVKVVEFTPERAEESAEDFVDEVLVDELSARVVVVGSDFHFGRGRGGNVALLKKMGPDRGFRVVPFDLVRRRPPGQDREAVEDAEPVSSTRIRRLISEGRLEAAASLLGRPHEVRGVVTRGDGTTCIEVPSEIVLPPPGEYAVLVGVVGEVDATLDKAAALLPAAIAGPGRKSVAVELKAGGDRLAQGARARALFQGGSPSVH